MADEASEDSNDSGHSDDVGNKRPKMEKLADRKENTEIFSYQSLRKLSRSLFDGRSHKHPVVCNQCGNSLKIFGKRAASFNIREVIRHASRHLDVKFLECQHCTRTYADKDSIQTHLTRVHRAPKDDYRNTSGDYIDDIADMMKHCFAVEDVKEKVSNRPYLLKHCRSILGKIVTSETRVICNECNLAIDFKNPHWKLCNGPLMAPVLDHALQHVPVKLFECNRQRQRTFPTRCITRAHLKNVHNWGRESNLDADIRDRSKNFVVEISAAIDRCFSTSGKKRTKQSDVKLKTKSEALVQNHNRGSKMTADRYLLCYRLIRQFAADKDGKISCRLCSKRINTKNGTKGVQTRRAMEHALVHLQLPLYRCKLCPELTFCTRQITETHLRKEHVLPFEMNHECVADEFDSKITAMIENCFSMTKKVDNSLESVRAQDEAAVRKNIKGSKVTLARNVFCRRLLRKAVDKEGQVQCGKCSMRINVGKNLSCSCVMNHVINHLQKPMYRCKVCSKMFRQYNTVGMHLRYTHKLPLMKNYDCTADEFQSDILKMLTECFGK